MNKKERAAELGKDLLIFLLVLSAIWLASRPQLYGRQISEWFGGFLESPGQAVSGETGTETGSEQAIHPVRMAVMTEQGRYGTPYDEEATQALFSTTANVLNEALNSVGPAERVSRGEWEKSLQLCPGIYFEFAAALPLSALSVLLSSDGETSGLEGRVSRLNLAVDQEGVRLFYINEENGLYYACDTDVVSQSQIETAIDGLTPNGVSFAFERQDCDNLASYTMLPDQTPLPAVYLSANPLTAETEEILLEQLGFRTQGTSYYEAPDGTVYLNSGDTLRVGEGGQILFTANPAGEARFTIGGGGGKDHIFRGDGDGECAGPPGHGAVAGRG